MTNRKTLYGYKIRNGEWEIVTDEAAVVARVFTLYIEGLSYQKISDTLNSEDISYCDEAPLWNKHKVKRLLENPRYTGRDGYPPMIEGEIFQSVQEQIHTKTSNYKPTICRPALQLKEYLRCNCGGKLHRLAGCNRRKDTLYLKCRDCGIQVTMTDTALLTEVSRQVAENKATVQTPYTPSEEVIRLTNAINRGLEHPNSPETIIDLILRGASARYDCCPTVLYKDSDRQLEVDWDHVRQAVCSIIVSAENTVTVSFQ